MNEQLVNIEILSSISRADADDLSSLLGQLSKTASFDRVRIEAIVAHEATDLLVARIDGRVVG